MSIRLIGLGAYCPHCRSSIGPLPFSVEVVAVLTLTLLAWRIHSPVALAAISWIAVLGIALVYIDIAVHRLPDRLTFLAFGGALVMFGIGDFSRMSGALLCCLALASGYLLMSVTSGGGLGLGDGKFALSLGLALGWFGWFATLYGAALGFVFAGLFAIIMLVIGRLSWTQAIPHGPFMLLGALVAILTTSG